MSKETGEQDWDQATASSGDDLQSLEDLHDSVVRSSSSPCVRSFCSKWTVLTAVMVRLVLLVHASIAVWLVVSLISDPSLWALLAALVLIVAEGAYTVVKRAGRESRWVCPCFLAYLAAVLPPVWLVELDRLDRFNEALEGSSNVTALVTVNGLSVPVRLEPEVWVSLMEQTLLFLLVLCRWLLPRGDISRTQLSQLLFVFMGIASDNMELFELFDETEVRQDLTLTYTILAVWSLSLLQFVFVLTATRSPRKAQVVHDQTLAMEEARKGKRKAKRGVCEILFATEIWSLVFSILVQDGPYAATRIYTLVKYDLLTYSIIFFICKNLLVICLVFYRLVIICVYKCSSDDDKKQDDEEEEGEKRVESERRDKRLLPRSRGVKVEAVSSVTTEPVPLGTLPHDLHISDV